MGIGCLFGLQGIPCLYCGTEQGLCGHGNAPEHVREALWRKPEGLDESNPFFRFIRSAAPLPREHPALRSGPDRWKSYSPGGRADAVDPPEDPAG
jgi:glycosidase